MKYIILKSWGIESAILFDENLSHSDFAHIRTPVSAGFCDAAGTAWGRSVSMNLESRLEDSAIIRASMERRV